MMDARASLWVSLRWAHSDDERMASGWTLSLSSSWASAVGLFGSDASQKHRLDSFASLTVIISHLSSVHTPSLLSSRDEPWLATIDPAPSLPTWTLPLASQRIAGGSEQLASATHLADTLPSQRRSSLGSMATTATANDMLRAASAMAAQASSGAEGLQAVSSALLNQAKAQASAAALSFNESAIHPSDPQSTPMTRNWSDSAGYSAAMSAHIASTLESQITRSTHPPSQPPPAAAPPSSAGDTSSLRPSDSADAEAQMGRIAAQAAAREAQTQWRTQMALRTAAALTQDAHSAIDPAAPDANASSSNTLDAYADASSITEYLRFLGLSHIEMPSQGIEQSFGRSITASARYWDATNPHMGFSLSGVPSMPLMPNPPLQMLPPPPSPSFRRKNSRARPAARHLSTASISSTDSSDTANDFEPNVMSPFPYPFQVVQTPGGTARAGWWVPVSEVPEERRAKAITVGEVPPPSAPGTNARSASKLESHRLDARRHVAFHTWRPLSASEQEAIAGQLRAWAGLDGPHAQAQARKALEQRQIHLIQRAVHRDLHESRDSDEQAAGRPETASDQLRRPEQATRFFPPDFASHYRTQLQALAEGYYTRLHNENLAQAHYAQPPARNAAPMPAKVRARRKSIKLRASSRSVRRKHMPSSRKTVRWE
ncbi:hypothetical protein L1887_61065 [Cichorium endivia]|nr:hypothetical protein L1887_61065 [Cichorium endivia]